MLSLTDGDMEKPLDQSNANYWRDMDFAELQQLIQRMRAVRLADAKLVREIEALGHDEPPEFPQALTRPLKRSVLGPL